MIIVVKRKEFVLLRRKSRSRSRSRFDTGKSLKKVLRIG